MKDKISDAAKLLLPALRQYQHNDGSGLLAGYDLDMTQRIVAALTVSPAPSGEVEAVEAVAWLDGSSAHVQPPSYVYYEERRKNFKKAMEANGAEPLMTVAQHQRIVAAKDAEIARLNEGFFRANKDALGVALERDELRAQLAAQQAAVPVAALVPFAEVVDLYDPSEDDSHEPWKDIGAHPALRLTLGHFRALLAAPAAPQQGVSVPEALLRRLIQGKPQDHESRAEGAALLREFARLNADRSTQTDAARDVLAERQRQISAEGWTPEHDDAHSGGELADAAACYALWSGGINPGNWREFWPWAPEWLKHGEPRRMLVKAGALILAEIERLDRSAQGGE